MAADPKVLQLQQALRIEQHRRERAEARARSCRRQLAVAPTPAAAIANSRPISRGLRAVWRRPVPTPLAFRAPQRFGSAVATTSPSTSARWG